MDARFALDDRAELEAATRGFLRRRSGLRADLRLLECDGELAVAKDWGEAPWINRPHGRWSLRREWRALLRLEGVPGVPLPLQRMRDAIIISYLDGKPLSSRSDQEVSDTFFTTLEARVAEIHARGVVHLDLRQRRNILIGSDGAPQIVDFEAAIDLHRWGPLGRLFLPLGKAVDRLAVLKLKARFDPADMPPAERRAARFARFVRYLWPPNWLRAPKVRLRRWIRG